MKKYQACKYSDILMTVVENPTGNVMYAGSPREGRPLVNKLNGGCGFNGFTPEFMFHRFSPNGQPTNEQHIFVEGKINV
jgi:hypothetical protein